MAGSVRLDSLKLTCPHCRQENPLVGEQRCTHCGLNMISDQEQHWRSQELGPRIQELDQQLLLLRTRGPKEASPAYVRKLRQELEPYSQVFPGIHPILEEADKELEPYPVRPPGPDTTLVVSLIILAVLVIIPLVGHMVGADGTLLFFLWLSAGGWAFVGVYGYLKKGKPRA